MVGRGARGVHGVRGSRRANDYSVQFLADYFAEYAEAASICGGNGVFVDGNATRANACESNWVGVECEIPCLMKRASAGRAR